MTDTRLARWERAVESYRAAEAEIARLEQLPDYIDPNLTSIAAANDRLCDALAGLVATTPPHLVAFGLKLAATPRMLEFSRFESIALPRLIEDWRSLSGL